LGADFWNSYPNGFPEDGTDSKSESFGGQCVRDVFSASMYHQYRDQFAAFPQGFNAAPQYFFNIRTFSIFQEFTKFIFTTFSKTNATAMFG